METQFNILIVGDSGVGKSSIIECFNNYINKSTPQIFHNHASETDKTDKINKINKPIIYNEPTTVHIEHIESYLYTKKNIFSDISIRMVDTSGNSKFDENKFEWIKYELETNNINAIIVVHDLSDDKSIENTQKYYKFISTLTKSIPIIDIGNKKDIALPSTTYQSHIDILKLTFTNFSYDLTSTYTNHIDNNIINPFEKLLQLITRKKNIKIHDKKITQKKRQRDPSPMMHYDLYDRIH